MVIALLVIIVALLLLALGLLVSLRWVLTCIDSALGVLSDRADEHERCVEALRAETKAEALREAAARWDTGKNNNTLLRLTQERDRSGSHEPIVSLWLREKAEEALARE